MSEETVIEWNATAMSREVVIDYTNWRGERGRRKVLPKRLFFGSTTHHMEPQWLLCAWDYAKDSDRYFAMRNVHSWERVRQGQ